MTSYCRIVIDRPRELVEPLLLSAFGADEIIPVAAAERGDFLLLAGHGCVAFDEVDSGPFNLYVAMEPEFLSELSAACEARITAIAVTTSVGWVSILVAERGQIIRRFQEFEDDVEIDEGELPEWEEKIRNHSWNAADDLVGMAQWKPEPSFLTSAFRRITSLFGTKEEQKTERDKLLEKFGFGDPVGAISTKSFHAKQNLKATDFRFEEGRLICTLTDESELSLSPVDVAHVSVDTVFNSNQVLFKFRDRRVLARCRPSMPPISRRSTNGRKHYRSRAKC